MNEAPFHILLVEDDEVDVMSIRRIVARQHLNCILHVTWNGLDALKRLRNEGDETPIPPDRRVVLLDLNMPLLGGIEFLRQLRSDPDLMDTPVVVLTTSAEECDRAEANKLDVAGYLIKPISARALQRLAAGFGPQQPPPIDWGPSSADFLHESTVGMWPSSPHGDQ